MESAGDLYLPVDSKNMNVNDKESIFFVLYLFLFIDNICDK